MAFGSVLAIQDTRKICVFEVLILPLCWEYAILSHVAQLIKTKVYRACRRFPALNESSVRDLPLVKQN